MSDFKLILSPDQTKNKLPTPPSVEKEPNDYLESLKKETSQPGLGPVYPWIAPPQQLPGPYDAPYYPLPLPTIRRHSHDPGSEKEEKTCENTSTISFTRRVSTNSLPDHETILEGSITTSTQGWRRTQWSVTAG